MPSHPFRDDWSGIDALFARALAQPRVERERFLAQACGADTELLAMLSDLLAASDRAEAELAGPGDGLLRRVFDAARDDAAPAGTAGEIIGRYRLLRELGRGGMATVFEAERVDGAYEQRVALKLLHQGSEPETSGRRLQIEARILSGLSHPNIARLLDAGTTVEGRAYLVMELVDGEPITARADRDRLSVDRRLALVRQVAEAVDFAHGHLVVHRDIKPSNVLVGRDGVVKLLDFGIAKLLDPEGAPPPDTGTATRWMTPGYASPEQILGRPVTTATDVHGLGVLLYELLSGRRPFGDEALAGFDLDRAVCERSPAPPSVVVAGLEDVAQRRAATPERLRRMLAGDLDAIVGKALRKDPGERYASVRALAADLERQRTGLPVEARAGLRAYHARKFVTRHWLAVSAAAAFVLVLATSSLALWRQQRATAEARDRSVIEAENARLVIGFLADVFRGRDPERAPPDTVTARDLLAWGSARVDAEFAGRPALQASLLEVLGSAYANLGLLDEAVEHLARSVTLTRQVHGDGSEETAHRLLRLSEIHRTNRDPEAARPHAEEALRTRRARLAGQDPELAVALLELARVRALLSLPDSAERSLEEALVIWRAGGAERDGRYTEALLDLARLRRMKGQNDEARRLYEEGIPRLRGEGVGGARLAAALNNYAFLLRTIGEYAAAAPVYRDALDLMTAAHGRGHPTVQMFGSNLASVLAEQGDVAGAGAVLRDNLEAARAQWPDGHWRVGAAHAALGRLLLRSRQWDEAFVQLREARAQYQRTIGADHLWTEFVEATLAAGQVAAGRAGLGREYLDRFYERRVAGSQEAATEVARQAMLDLLIPFVRVLEDLQLDGEAARFRALVETPSGEGS